MNLFHNRLPPEPADPAGYAVLIDRYHLQVPLPYQLAAIAERHSPKSTPEWQLLTPRHRPDDSLSGHLVFALKWEGVRLSVLNALFGSLEADLIEKIIQEKPTSRYGRRIWFLYEWLTDTKLDIPDLGKVKAVPILDASQQFGINNGTLSARHRVINNLPGTRAFCPLVWKSRTLESFIEQNLKLRASEFLGEVHPDVLTRAAAFLLSGDSKASFQIEGENPSKDRTQRWGNAIEMAGSVEMKISELERLQTIVISDDRFVKLGLRTEGSFIGQHDRSTGEPIPEHICARVKDLRFLLDGVMDYVNRSLNGGVDPVVVAAAAAFGFVFIHPFVDGNGRIHRWLIHHILAKGEFYPKQIVFPVSAVMYRRMHEYKMVLEAFSKHVFPFIEWISTENNNVDVQNETRRLYSYFDATQQSEFLFECVQETITNDLPGEVAYLDAYRLFGDGIRQLFDMTETTVHLLHRFLGQNGGKLSNRARTKEFESLSDAEAAKIELLFSNCFEGVPTGVMPN